MGRYGLRFISGRYQGVEYPLPDDGELLIGRAADLDIVLVEDMVSRKHARFVISQGNITISDLGSTNGTFVNGEKIQQRNVGLHDRILVGTSIVKIVAGSDLLPENRDAAAVKQRMLAEATKKARQSTMSGDLSDVPLPDLLQLFSTNRKSGTLIIAGTNSGKLFIKEGHLVFAAVGEETWMHPMKALCRMLAWTHGGFRFEKLDENVAYPIEFSQSTEGLLMEASRQNDELQRVMQQLPDPNGRVELADPLAPKLSALTPAELDTLQAAINHGSIRKVIDYAPASDFEAASHLQKLLNEGYLETA